MRKELTLWRFALAVLSVSICGGCAKTTTDGAEEDLVPMRFSVSGIATRAAVNGASDLQQKGKAFDVWGTYTRTASGGGTTGQTFKVFDATQVTYDGTAWTYGDPQYWFPGFTYNFRALYPSGTKGVTFDGSSLKIQNFDATQSTDLLLAAPAAIECRVNPTMNAVKLTFTHLLSRVVFVGRSDETHLGKGRQIVIDEAKLYGLSTTGSWSGENFTTATPGTWTPGALAGNANTPYSIDKSTHGEGLTLPTDGTNIFANELFIPQKLTTNCILEITFHYNVEIGTAQSFKATVNLSTLTPKWEAGKSYRYPFTVSNHIFFEKPTIDQWQDAPVNDQAFNIYPTN